MKSIKVLAAAAVIVSSICTLSAQGAYASSNEEADTNKSDVEKVVSTGESTAEKLEVGKSVTTEETTADKAVSKTETNAKKGTITLDENPTTGFEWKYKVENDNIAAMESTTYKSDVVDSDVCGSGGKRTWNFKGLKAGETKVTFKYTRGEFDTASEPDVQIKVYTLKVDKDLNVTVSEYKEQTVKKDGWNKNENSTWSYYKNGESIKMQWLHDGPWYYLNNEGIMVTGWNKIGGYWYYFNTSGAMQTGWLKDDGKWYYLRGSGVMATGWIEDAGDWYYLNQSGVMLADTTVDGYQLGSSGAWIK